MEKAKKRNNKRILFTSFVAVYIFFSLVNFYDSVNKRKETVNFATLQDLANQSAAVLNEQIKYSFEFLENLAYLSEDYALDDPMLINMMKSFTVKSDFNRLGIADVDGNAVVTNGKRLNISDREFFDKSMNGEMVISDNLESKVSDEEILICSVPLKEKDGQIRGVFYGILDKERLVSFNKSVIENDYHYVHVIDGEGNYVYFSEHENNLVQNEENFFEGLAGLQSNFTVDEIKYRLSNQTNLVVKVDRGDDHRYVYFSNLGHSNWSAVSVVDQAYVTASIDSLLKQDVLVLTVNIIGALILLGFVIYYYQNKEKQFVNRLNKKMARNEVVYKAAAFSEDKIVFVYDIRHDQLKFISGKLTLFELNEVIERATVSLLDLFDYSGNLEEILEKMKNVLTKEETSFDDEVELVIHGEKRVYRLFASSLFGTDDCVETVVGNLRDITSEKENLLNLKMKAEMDALTGAYSREGGIKKIKKKLLGGGHHALLLLDLDHFKELNDTLGHKFGDQALVDVSHLLIHYFRKNDVVCRLGGDEFVIFIEDIEKDVVVRIVKTLVKRLNRTYEDGDLVCMISGSIGITLVPSDGSSFEELYEKADKALYRAKSLGRNRCCLFEGDIEDEESSL